MGVLDDLDGASDAEIQRLLGVVTGERGPRVPVSGRQPVKLGKRPRKAKRLPWEPRFENLNETVKIEIELPAYMVVGMRENGEEYREAVRDWLIKRGLNQWAESRFLRGSEAAMQDAKDRFTRHFGG